MMDVRDLSWCLVLGPAPCALAVQDKCLTPYRAAPSCSLASQVKMCLTRRKELEEQYKAVRGWAGLGWVGQRGHAGLAHLAAAGWVDG